jgi:signal transduction histidine kinase
MLAQIRTRWQVSMTTRLVLGFCVLMLFTVFLLIALISTMMPPRMNRTMDIAMRSQARILQAALQNEEDFLIHEAITIANLEGMSAALTTKDTTQIKRVLTPLTTAHELITIYIIDEERRVLFRLGDPIAEDESIGRLPLVERGFDRVVASAPLEFQGRLWLGGIAAHRSTDRAREGRIDAVILLGKQMNRRYLQPLCDVLDLQIAMAWGGSITYSFDPVPSEIPLNHLRAAENTIAEYREGTFAYHGMSINQLPYRVAAFAFPSRDGTLLAAYLFQPLTMQAESMQTAIIQVVSITIAVMLLGTLLGFLFARGLTRPLTHLAHAARAIAAGSLEHPVWIESRDEVGELAQTFEEMRVRIRTMLQAQQSWNAELEDKVRAKTRELQALCELRDQLLRQMIAAREEENHRVARELHDETSQALTALIANLAVAQTAPPDESRARLGQLKAATVEILKEINRIVLDLRPTLLDDYGLIPALEWYAKNRLEANGIEVTTARFGAETRLQSPVETVLFRVGQEAINNIVKHATARRVQINFHFAMEPATPTLTVQIEDDGCGFDVTQVRHQSPGERARLGLLGMEERLSAVNGQLEIRSAPGKGACVRATVPLA